MGFGEQWLWYGKSPPPNLQLELHIIHFHSTCTPQEGDGREKGGRWEKRRKHSSEQVPKPRSKSLDQIFLVTLSVMFMIPETGLIVFWKMSGLVLKRGQNYSCLMLLPRLGFAKHCALISGTSQPSLWRRMRGPLEWSWEGEAKSWCYWWLHPSFPWQPRCPTEGLQGATNPCRGTACFDTLC